MSNGWSTVIRGCGGGWSSIVGGCGGGCRLHKKKWACFRTTHLLEAESKSSPPSVLWYFSLLSIWMVSSIFSRTLEAYGRPGNKVTETVTFEITMLLVYSGRCNIDIQNQKQISSVCGGQLSSNTIWPSFVYKEITQKVLLTSENNLFIFIKHEDDRMDNDMTGWTLAWQGAWAN